MEVMCFGLGVGHDVWEEVYLSSCRSCGVADIAAAAVFVMRDSQESGSILRSRDGTKKTGGTTVGGGPVDGREPVAVHSVRRW